MAYMSIHENTRKCVERSLSILILPRQVVPGCNYSPCTNITIRVPSVCSTLLCSCTPRLRSIVLAQCPVKLALDFLLTIRTTAHGDSPTNAEQAIEEDNNACKAHDSFVKMKLSTGDDNAYRDSLEAERNGEYDDCGRMCQLHSITTCTSHTAVLTIVILVPKPFAFLSVQRQLYLAIHNPAILVAEDIKVHGRRIAAKLLSGAFGPERCESARTIGRHVSRFRQKVYQEVRDLHGRRFRMWEHINLVFAVL